MDVILDDVEKLINETNFSSSAKEKMEGIFSEAKKRGSLTAEEKVKLLEVIEADMFLDDVELEARKSVLSILEELEKAEEY